MPAPNYALDLVFYIRGYSPDARMFSLLNISGSAAQSSIASVVAGLDTISPDLSFAIMNSSSTLDHIDILPIRTSGDPAQIGEVDGHWGTWIRKKTEASTLTDPSVNFPGAVVVGHPNSGIRRVTGRLQVQPANAAPTLNNVRAFDVYGTAADTFWWCQGSNPNILELRRTVPALAHGGPPVTVVVGTLQRHGSGAKHIMKLSSAGTLWQTRENLVNNHNKWLPHVVFGLNALYRKMKMSNP